MSDRFQRASYYLSMVPTPKSEREGVASVLAIMRNVSVPFGAPYKGFGVYNTEYRTVSDTTNKIYYFELTTSPSVIWTDLKSLDFRPGAPVRVAVIVPSGLAVMTVGCSMVISDRNVVSPRRVVW